MRIYEENERSVESYIRNSTMSTQSLRYNAVTFRKDKLLLTLTEVRDGNGIKQEMIHIGAIEPVRIVENIN